MKCPNCSFVNPDNSTICKICGFELSPSKEKNTTPEVSDADIEVTFDTLFGVRSNPRKMKNPLDRSKDKKRLREQTHDSETPFDDSSDTTYTNSGAESHYTARDSSFEEPPVESPVESPLDSPTEEPIEEHSKEYSKEYSEEYSEVFAPATDDAPFEKADTSDPVQDDDVIDIELTKNGDPENDFYLHEDDIMDSTEKAKNQKMTIFLLIIVLLLVVAVFAFTSSRFKDKPDNSEPVAPTETSEPSAPSESKTSTQAPEDLISNFFNELPDYINNGNISFLTYFKTPQQSLDQLNAIKAIGNIDKIDYSITDSKANGETAYQISVNTNTNRSKDDKHIISQDSWQFELILENQEWAIDSFTFNGEKAPATTDTTSPASSASTPSSTTTTKPATSTTPKQSTEVDLSTFTKTGTFKGGIITDGQDLSGIRFGNHDQFERLVLDLSEWQKTAGDGSAVPVKEACHYETTISADGLEITVTMSGIRAASAGTPTFPSTANIKSVNAFYPSDDSTVGLSISLKSPSSYKVFSLKEPGRIVIDILANK